MHGPLNVKREASFFKCMCVYMLSNVTFSKDLKQ